MLSQKPMLRQLEWEVQTGRITKNGVLPLSTFLFENLIVTTSYKYVPITQMSTFIIFVST